MKEKYERYEANIKKKHSFAWNPKFEKHFSTQVNEKVFGPIALKAFEELEWQEITVLSDTLVSAKRIREFGGSTEIITVEYEFGKVTVRSASHENGMWDFGRNSKRVLLFIYAFQEVAKDYNREALKELEEEVERERNWDNYKVPESLMMPLPTKKPRIAIPIIGGLAVALFLGFVFASLVSGIGHAVILFEVLTALGIGLAFKYLIRFSGYTNSKVLTYILALVIVVTYLSCEFYQFSFIPARDLGSSFTFIDFLVLKVEIGFVLDQIDLGSVGMIAVWIVQLVLTYIVAMLRVMNGVIAYFLDRVPQEVVDFIMYHMVKEHKEEEIRAELAARGWTEKADQDEAFEAVGILIGAIQHEQQEATKKA